MGVIGLTFSNIEANKKKTDFKGGEIKINFSHEIKEVKELDVAALGKKAVSINFEFSTKYDPDIGNIKMGGEILYLSKDQGEIVKKWKKDKKLPDDVFVDVLNHLFRKCLLKMSNIAEDLQLPPTLQFPRVKAPEQQQASYVG